MDEVEVGSFFKFSHFRSTQYISDIRITLVCKTLTGTCTSPVICLMLSSTVTVSDLQDN